MAVSFLNLAGLARYDNNIKKFIKDGFVNADYFATIQDAIDYAHTNGLNVVRLSGKTYTITNTLAIYSGMTLEGIEGATLIKMTGVDAPIIESTGSILGHTVIKNLKLEGDTAKVNNTGITLCDYYSKIENVKVMNVGSHGIELIVGGATGNLVENKINGCTVTNAQGISYYLGVDDNGKLTDGFLIDCISYGSGDNYAVALGSGAGWKIDGLHVYGHDSVDIPVYIHAGYNTVLSNIYIESFDKHALQLGGSQLGIALNNINVVVYSSNAISAITMDKSGVYDFECNITVNNINVMNSSVNGFTVIDGVPYGIKCLVKNVGITGPQADNTQIISDAMSGSAFTNDGVALARNLSDVSGELVHGNEKVAKFVSAKYTGSSAQTFNFVLNDLTDYSKIVGKLRVHSCSWDDGVGRSVCVQEFFLSRKITSSKISVYDVVTAGGFSVNPALSYDVATNTLTVTFTDGSGDATGVCAVEYCAHY